MSDEPFFLPHPPLMSAVEARNLARMYKSMADHLRSRSVLGEVPYMERQSAWWLAYAISLSQTPPGAIE